MKRCLLILLLCTPFLFTSCEKNYYGSTVDTYYQVVQPRDWQGVGVFGQPGYVLEARFSAPYITPNVIENGGVVAYAIFDDGDIQLPFVLTRDVGYTIIEILSYRLESGRIIFTIDNSDFMAEPFDRIEFKIVVVQ